MGEIDEEITLKGTIKFLVFILISLSALLLRESHIFTFLQNTEIRAHKLKTSIFQYWYPEMLLGLNGYLKIKNLYLNPRGNGLTIYAKKNNSGIFSIKTTNANGIEFSSSRLSKFSNVNCNIIFLSEKEQEIEKILVKEMAGQETISKDRVSVGPGKTLYLSFNSINYKKNIKMNSLFKIRLGKSRDFQKLNMWELGTSYEGGIFGQYFKDNKQFILTSSFLEDKAAQVFMTNRGLQPLEIKKDTPVFEIIPLFEKKELGSVVHEGNFIKCISKIILNNSIDKKLIGVEFDFKLEQGEIVHINRGV